MKIAGSRVLVIGGAGFIGSHLVDQLLDHGPHEVRIFDNLVRGKRANISHRPRVNLISGSIMDVGALQAAMKDVHYVFHLAALWLGECVNDPRSAVDVNVVGTYNVVEACRDLGVRRLVFSSSASVYGNPLATPMTEDHPFNNRTFYGATKIAGEQFCRAFHEMHQLNYVGLRYMNVYGPRMDDRGTYVSVIMKVLERIEAGLSPVIHGDGSQAYDFVHVRDVARANVLALQADVSDQFFNVGTGIKTTINEVVLKLLDLTGSSVTPEYRRQEQVYVTQRLGCTRRAEELLNFKAEVPLDEGLQSVVRWRQENYRQLSPSLA